LRHLLIAINRFFLLDVCLLYGPIDIVHSFHNAFRRDIFQIDNAALKTAQSSGDFASLFDRIQIFSEVLDYHARGEEAAVFPAVDKLAPFVVTTYLKDHRELDIMTNGLEVIRKSPDPLTTARATAVLNSHLRIHLDKEDAYLYPFLKERTTRDEQVAIAGALSKQIPPEKFPILAHWLFPLLEIEEQVVVAEVWKSLMPPQVFEGAKLLIKKETGQNWLELTRRIPDLNTK
jgi:iron-sulfur cluster repair protein YtfE (RIC family)